jgi:site-specific DNA-adenine methylase
MRPIMNLAGGKGFGKKFILPHFPIVNEMLSPFPGAMHCEVAMAKRGVFIHAYSQDLNEANFYRQVMKDKRRVYARAKEYLPLFERDPDPKALFLRLQTKLIEGKDRTPDNAERAALFYVVNKASWCGTTYRSGYRPFGSTKLTLSNMQAILAFDPSRFSMRQGDFREAFARHPSGMFAYVDPPYPIADCYDRKRGLYGIDGKLHLNFDHEALCECVKERPNWIMSNTDNERVRAMYRGFEKIKLDWKYGANGDRKSSELLIFSRDLHPNQRFLAYLRLKEKFQ